MFPSDQYPEGHVELTIGIVKGYLEKDQGVVFSSTAIVTGNFRAPGYLTVEAGRYTLYRNGGTKTW